MTSIQNGIASAIKLDDELLEKIKDSVKERKIRICNIDISPGSEKGDNYLGIIAKVRVNGVGEKCGEVTLNWIAKTAPGGELLLKYLNMDKLYGREVYVYEKIFPLFAKFQAEKSVLKAFDFHADYVCSLLERRSFVMEDMKSIGYFMKDRKKPMDYDHVKLVMEAYGKLHAISFALRDQLPEEFQQLIDDMQELIFNPAAVDDEITQKQRESIHSRVLNALDAQSEGGTVLIEKYRKYIQNDVEIVEKATKRINQYSIISHGDSWSNNMLFKYENKEDPARPTRVCLLDWQLSRYCSPALDLSYFIFTCTDKALRDQHYEHMIKLYYYSLCQHLVDLGSDPEKLFPFSALQTELKECAVFGLQMSSVLVHLMTSEVNEIPDFQNTKPDDIAWDYESVNHNLYNDRIKGIVTNFVEYGYLDF